MDLTFQQDPATAGIILTAALGAWLDGDDPSLDEVMATWRDQLRTLVAQIPDDPYSAIGREALELWDSDAYRGAVMDRLRWIGLMVQLAAETPALQARAVAAAWGGAPEGTAS